MPTIDPNAGLAPGQQYTLSMAEAGIVGTVIGTNVDKVNADLSAGEDSGAIDVAAGATATQSVLSVLSQAPYDITFTYTGNGSDSPMDVFQEFINVLNGFAFSWDYVICVGGTAAGTTAAQTQAQIASAANTVANAAKIATTPSVLWPIVLLAVIAIFFFSGGASILRHATA